MTKSSSTKFVVCRCGDRLLPRKIAAHRAACDMRLAKLARRRETEIGVKDIFALEQFLRPLTFEILGIVCVGSIDLQAFKRLRNKSLVTSGDRPNVFRLTQAGRVALVRRVVEMKEEVRQLRRKKTDLTPMARAG